MDLFSPEQTLDNTPLAALLRPQELKNFVGQSHMMGDGQALRLMIENDRLSSLMFYGPPGTGKTSLARLIATHTQAYFVSLNAVEANTKDIRQVVDEALYQRSYDRAKTILFVDEVHRFNKAQQDVLMPYVEEGVFVFIGATTENPFFALNAPLLSRAHVFAFEPLSVDELKQVLDRALHHSRKYLSHVRLSDGVATLLAEGAEGDARRVINLLDFMVKSKTVDAGGLLVIDVDDVLQSGQVKALVYDGEGDNHYDTISAFIKSMRGSDPDAALYWLAKMFYAGEDLNFIGRRIVICAAEDVGNADPRALQVAHTAWEVALKVGMPEARIPLAQAVTYIATAPKSNAAYLGIDRALDLVKQKSLHPVPKHLKDAGYPGAKTLGHGQGYRYPHLEHDHFNDQEYAPLKEALYTPTGLGYEKTIKERMDYWTKRKSAKPSPKLSKD